MMDDAASVMPYALCMHAFGRRSATQVMVAGWTAPAPTSSRRTEGHRGVPGRVQRSWSIAGTAMRAVMLCRCSVSTSALGEYFGRKAWLPPAMSTASADEMPPVRHVSVPCQHQQHGRR